jgi:hypothetical protein
MSQQSIKANVAVLRVAILYDIYVSYLVGYLAILFQLVGYVASRNR